MKLFVKLSLAIDLAITSVDPPTQGRKSHMQARLATWGDA